MKVSEYTPKNFSSWHQYYEHKRRVEKIKNFLVPTLTILLLVLAYWVVAVIECYL